MTGTILENLSNRKLIGVLAIICFIQLTSFIIGAFISECYDCDLIITICLSSPPNHLLLLLSAPAPSSPEQYIANQCVAENPAEFSIPRTDSGKPQNCRSPQPHEQG